MDAEGEEVPAWMQEVFQGRRWLDGWGEFLAVMINHLSVVQTADFMRDVDVESVIALLVKARAMVKFGSPHSLCVCRDSRGCPLCDGDKWTSAKRLWTMLERNYAGCSNSSRRHAGSLLNEPMLRRAVSAAQVS